MSLQIEIEFILPRGYVDADGQLHREGRMRLATAQDEIEAVLDPRVQASDAYLPVVLLSRVVTRLGDLPALTPQMAAGLFAADLAYLQDLYLWLNDPGTLSVGATCPHCNGALQLQISSGPQVSGQG